MRILVPIPTTDFDPTETSIPWRVLSDAGHKVVFATPTGDVGRADTRMVDGNGLGIWRGLLRAREDARRAYADMQQASAFADPLAYDDLDESDFEALLLPGGHAPGMKPYLESQRLQNVVAAFFGVDKPVGAICHGVVLAARATDEATGRSVLHGRRTTALTNSMERSAWLMTCAWLGDYYRTYPTTVQDEVTAALAAPEHFVEGPVAILRDAPDKLERGFVVRDNNYLSARWPGDAYRFATEFRHLLAEA